jgi:hypothetical protein
MPEESELKKYIKKLEARIEALEKSAEDRVHNFGEKWFKKTPTETTKTTPVHGDGELRLVLMGPPGAGNLVSISRDRLLTVFRKRDTIA